MPATIRASPGYSRRNARQPADVGASIEPGTRKQSRPCSSAQPAVIRAPLPAGRLDDDRRVGQPADQAVPARERALGGARVGRQLGDDRATRLDDRRRPAARAPWGRADACPDPRTATVGAPAATAAAWAAPSIPTASPDTTTAPDPAPARRRSGRRSDGPPRSAGASRRRPRRATPRGPRRRPGRTAPAAALRAGAAGPDRPASSTVTNASPSPPAAGRGSPRPRPALDPSGRDHLASAAGRGRRRGSVADRAAARPGVAASSRTGRPLPCSRSRSANVAGPRPWTEARTAQASRSCDRIGLQLATTRARPYGRRPARDAGSGRPPRDASWRTRLGAVEVGDRPGDPQAAADAAGRQPGRRRDRCRPAPRRVAARRQAARRARPVEPGVGGPRRASGRRPGRRDPGGDRRARFRPAGPDELRRGAPAASRPTGRSGRGADPRPAPT